MKPVACRVSECGHVQYPCSTELLSSFAKVSGIPHALSIFTGAEKQLEWKIILVAVSLCKNIYRLKAVFYIHRTQNLWHLLTNVEVQGMFLVYLQTSFLLFLLIH